MTIDQAITDLQARVDGEFYINGADDCKDMKLGIEALKHFKYHRDSDIISFVKQLPGETEE